MSRFRTIGGEAPLLLLPQLAVEIGVNEALVLQQIAYLLQQPRTGRVIDGELWVFNSIDEWQAQYFPFLSVPTLNRVMAELKERGLLITCQPEKFNRRCYYRIDWDAIEVLEERIDRRTHSIRLIESCDDQIDQPILSKRETPYIGTKTSSNSSGEQKKKIQEGEVATDGRTTSTVGTKCGDKSPDSADPLLLDAPPKRFTPPRVDEVTDFLKASGLNGESARQAEAFVNHHAARGWMLGRVKMKDWKAAARTWKMNFERFNAPSSPVVASAQKTAAERQAEEKAKRDQYQRELEARLMSQGGAK